MSSEQASKVRLTLMVPSSPFAARREYTVRMLASGGMRHDMSEYECGFCDQDRFRSADVYIENSHCIFLASRDPELRAEPVCLRTCFQAPESSFREPTAPAYLT
jgi:hypothetical protein